MRDTASKSKEIPESRCTSRGNCERQTHAGFYEMPLPLPTLSVTRRDRPVEGISAAAFKDAPTPQSLTAALAAEQLALQPTAFALCADGNGNLTRAGG